MNIKLALAAILVLAALRRADRWRRSPQRKLKTILVQATPFEKTILEAVIRRGKHTVDLDAGSDIALHLQEIGLIAKSPGMVYTLYQLAPGLADLCLRKPALFHVTVEEQEAALAVLERWRNEGMHKRLLKQLAATTPAPHGLASARRNSI